MGLASEVSIAVRHMRDDAEAFVRAVNLTLWRGIILDTPVDMGRLQGNWQTTEVIPASGVLDRTFADGPLAEAEAKLRGFGLFWLTNNLPYAGVAEFGGWGTGPYATVKTTRDGFSVQAPYGMVRQNVARIESVIARHRNIRG